MTYLLTIYLSVALTLFLVVIIPAPEPPRLARDLKLITWALAWPVRLFRILLGLVRV